MLHSSFAGAVHGEVAPEAATIRPCGEHGPLRSHHAPPSHAAFTHPAARVLSVTG